MASLSGDVSPETGKASPPLAAKQNVRARGIRKTGAGRSGGRGQDARPRRVKFRLHRNQFRLGWLAFQQFIGPRDQLPVALADHMDRHAQQFAVGFIVKAAHRDRLQIRLGQFDKKAQDRLEHIDGVCKDARGQAAQFRMQRPDAGQRRFKRIAAGKDLVLVAMAEMRRDLGAEAGDAEVSGQKEDVTDGATAEPTEEPTSGATASPSAEPTSTATTGPVLDAQQRLDSALSKADQAMKDSNEAMANSDWTAYGKAQDELQAAIQDAIDAKQELGD